MQEIITEKNIQIVRMTTAIIITIIIESCGDDLLMAVGEDMEDLRSTVGLGGSVEPLEGLFVETGASVSVSLCLFAYASIEGGREEELRGTSVVGVKRRFERAQEVVQHCFLWLSQLRPPKV